VTAAPATEVVRLQREGPVAWLTLNRPERLNAFNAALHAALSEALDSLELDPPHVLVITGEGRAFSAGQDLTEAPRLEPGQRLDIAGNMDRTYNAMVRRLAALPCVQIAAVNGVAAGAGLGLALSADILVAARSARFVLAFGKIGLGPDAGVSWWLPRLIGGSRALGYILTGEPLSAEQAHAFGMVWEVVDDADLPERVRHLAAALSTGSREAQAAAKRLVKTPAPTLDAQLDRERDEQDALGRTSFHHDAVRAFGARS
jgi:2-(1,2-epoxy-1,2-dihydrophenyl)acetyl-CoA isomerase